MNNRVISGAVFAVMVAGTVVACGGSSPTSPSGGGGAGSPGPVGGTVTMTPGGTNSVSITTGQSVTFVNNDTRSRTMSSDPHPVHTDCPALNIGILSPGQSKTTNAFTAARTCGFHDHDDPDNNLARGTVTVR